MSSKSNDPDTLVVLREFSDHFAADVAKSALEAAGIECLVHSDDAGGLRPGLWMGNGVQLFVRAEDAQRADALLNSSNP